MPIVHGGGKVVHLEPGATVGEVSTFLLAQTPPLQLEACLEMEDATLGGLAMAQGMTTHSHVCGLVSETVTEYEVVTGAGDRVVATAANEHAKLFRALPMSHGSLGLLVSLKLRVVPAKKFVRLTYRPLASAEALHAEYTKVLAAAASVDVTSAEASADLPFFVEAIAFSPERAVLMTGQLADKALPGEPVNHISRWYKPWYYKHVESFLPSPGGDGGGGGGGEPVTECIPIRDYLMRHDRSMCMTMGTIIPYGNNPVFRFLLGWLLPPQMSFLKASHTEDTREASVRKQCYQDVCFPAGKLPEVRALSDRLFNIYPLLVYPCKVRARGGLLRVGGGRADGAAQMNLNLGIYGVPPELAEGAFPLFPMVTRVRELEAWLRANGGFQHTYCDSFQTEGEFEAMFDHGLYREMRGAYGAEGRFPSVFAKTRPEVDFQAWLKEEEAARV